jgi:cell division protein FtsB
MLEFYQKRSWRVALKSWWFVGFLGVCCLLLLIVVFDRYTIEQEMSLRRAEAEERLADLEERKTMMQDKVEYLSSERGVEAEMRRNFDVAQPGEQVVIILDPKKEENTVEPLTPLSTEDTPPWYIFWR